MVLIQARVQMRTGCHIYCIGASQIEESRMKALRVNYAMYTEVSKSSSQTKLVW